MAAKSSGRWWRWLLATLLLPACWGGFAALRGELAGLQHASTVWVPMGAGVLCWGVIFWLLPEPVWIYVLGHELTHALWAWLCGGRVTSMKVTSRGGHVTVSKTNALITLAPYFFPLYAVLVAAGYWVGGMFWNWAPYRPWFLVLLGAAYAFHVTMTLSVLRVRQPDITQNGWFFSGVAIVLGNLFVLLLAVPLLVGLSPMSGLQDWGRETANAWVWLANSASRSIRERRWW